MLTKKSAGVYKFTPKGGSKPIPKPVTGIKMMSDKKVNPANPAAMKGSKKGMKYASKSY